MTSTMAPVERTDMEEQTVMERATTVVAEVGAQVHTAAVDAKATVADRAPAALSASRDTAERVSASLRGRSDGWLALATAFAAGLSGGMLVARGPRLLVALAFIATMVFGGTLMGRGAADVEVPSRKARV